MSASEAASDATNNNFNELGATVGRQNTWIIMKKTTFFLFLYLYFALN